MNILDKFKEADLKKLGNENIPFVSSGSRSKLAVRNMKFKVTSINPFKEEVTQEEVIEDDSEFVDEEIDPKKIKPLPNLDFKFVCANSLIPRNTQKQISFAVDPNLEDNLLSVRDQYFSARSAKRKEGLKIKYKEPLEVRGFSIYKNSKE